MDVSYSLSGEDIKNFFGGQVKILLFSDIADYDTLDDLLDPYGRVVILFERSRKTGHWTGLFRSSKETYKGKPRVFFFDSYGIRPESELKYSEGKNVYLKQRRNTLLRLFKGQGVKYSDVQLQKWKPNINSCGRHVLARLSCDNLNSYEYADLIKSQTNDPDQFITDATNLYLK